MDARVAVLASGEGTNLQALLDDPVVARNIALVVSDNPEARVLGRAEEYGVKTAIIEPTSYPDREAYDSALLSLLKEEEIRFVVLAGFMRMLGPELVAAFTGRMLNIHPSVLPAFPGTDAIGDALDWGARVTGVTVHLVDDQMDHGPIVLQESLPIFRTDDRDSLEPRIHELEHRLYRVAVRAMIEGRLEVSGRHVTILESAPR